MSVTEVPRSEVQDAFAAVLQARLSWPQAEGCAADLRGYLQRQGLVVFREYHPDEVRDLASQLHALCDRHEWGALRWEDPLPVPEWIAEVRALLPPRDPSQTSTGLDARLAERRAELSAHSRHAGDGGPA